MLLVYASKTGNVERFVQKLPLERYKISSGSEVVEQPCVLVTYTTGFGSVPSEVQRFVANNQHQILAVAASGNRNWGNNFAKSAHSLSQQLSIPVLHTFEMSGTKRDIQTMLEQLQALEHRDLQAIRIKQPQPWQPPALKGNDHIAHF